MDWKQLLALILPPILQMLEAAFANRAGQPSTGPVKKGAAVNLAQNALMVAAASPDLVSMSDATNTPAIASEVEVIVQDMKSQGKLGGHKNPTPIKTINVKANSVPTLADIDKSIDKAIVPSQIPRFKLPSQFQK